MIIVNTKSPLFGALKSVAVYRGGHHQDKKEGHQTFHEKPRLSFWAVGEQFKTCRKSFPDVLLRTQ